MKIKFIICIWLAFASLVYWYFLLIIYGYSANPSISDTILKLACLPLLVGVPLVASLFVSGTKKKLRVPLLAGAVLIPAVAYFFMFYETIVEQFKIVKSYPSKIENAEKNPAPTFLTRLPEAPLKPYIDNNCISITHSETKDKKSNTSEIRCPSEDFTLFLKQFVNDESTQRAFTELPLIYESVDIEAHPEPKTITKALNHDQIKFPIIKLCKERQEIPLEINLINSDSARAEIKVEKPDTDWLVRYVFVKKDCWKLVRVKDSSL